MARITGKSLNRGCVKGQAVVFEVPFSFIGDFDPNTGKVTMNGHPLFGTVLKDKILVIPTGKGGTIAPYIAYYAQKNGVAPIAILCNKADSITLECALTIDIPIMEGFSDDITRRVTTGSEIEVNGDEGFIEIG
jgi:predicted aconitase with swiveling domain